MSCRVVRRIRSPRTREVLAVSVVASVTTLAVAATPETGSAADASSTLFAEGGSFDLNLIDALQNSTGGTAAIAPLVPGYFNANIDVGRDDFASLGVDYAVSEFPLTASQAATAATNNRSFAYVPFAASPVAISAIVECSDDGVRTATTFCPNLQLTVPLLAKAMTNQISSWDDPQFSQSSGGNKIAPTSTSANISPVNQVDPSAVNFALASLFVNDPTNGGAANQTWLAFLARLKISNETPSELWPTGGGLSGGDRSVANALIPVNEQTLMAENPQSWGGGDVAGLPVDWLGPPRDLPTVAIQNVAGQFVSPTVSAMSAALQDATMDPKTNLVTFHANAANAAAYPIPTMSYLVVPTSGLSAAKAAALAAFIRYVLGSQGQAAVSSFGAAPVTPSMVTAGLAVANVVAREATTTTTTTTTSTTTTTRPPKTTPASTGATKTSLVSSESGGAGGATPPAGAAPTLAFTGSAPWSIPVAGGVMLLVGAFARRELRRRVQARGSVP